MSPTLAFSPDELFVYFIGADNGLLTVFSRDEITGDLTFIQTYPIQANDLLFSQDGQHAYTFLLIVPP